MIPSGGAPTATRLYRPRVSTWWWTRKRSYLVFVMRELSSIFIAWFVVFLVLFVWAIGRGEAAYRGFLDWAASPWVVVLNLVAAAFLVLHVVTWFSLTPKAMAVSVGGRPVPAAVVIGVQYAVLLAVSALVYWLVTR